jgi:hypothetical protein
MITVEDAIGNPSGGQTVSAYIIGPGYLSFSGTTPIGSVLLARSW